MTSLVHLMMALWMAAASAASPAPGKLAPAVSKEMTEAIVAVNKALGLESWPMHGAEPCVDRGGQGITAKDVIRRRRAQVRGGGGRQGLPGARQVVRARDPDGLDRPRHGDRARHRRQRGLGRLLVRSRAQVQPGQAERAVEVGEAHRRATGEGLRGGRRRSGCRPTPGRAPAPPRPPSTDACSRPTQTRALRKSRIQGPSSRQPRGRQELCTARNTRSGWGMNSVTRPSGVVSAVTPPGEPFGFSG